MSLLDVIVLFLFIFLKCLLSICASSAAACQARDLRFQHAASQDSADFRSQFRLHSIKRIQIFTCQSRLFIFLFGVFFIEKSAQFGQMRINHAQSFRWGRCRASIGDEVLLQVPENGSSWCSSRSFLGCSASLDRITARLVLIPLSHKSAFGL